MNKIKRIPKTAYLHVKMTPQEREKVREAAKADNFSNMSEWVRKTVFDRIKGGKGK